MDTKELQTAVAKEFGEIFGDTPLKIRLDDILGEAQELHRATDRKSLKSELSDLLASVIQLANEEELDVADLVFNINFPKIRARREQYRSLGRKTYVAILGGAFDPPTLGHIETAKYVLKVSRLFDEVWLLPTFSHPFNKDTVSTEHRVAMCKIAAEADRRIRVSDFEIQNQLGGQTIQTVKLLLADKAYDGKYNFSWIMGMDNANTCMQEWVQFPVLEKMVRFVIVPRLGYPRDEHVDWYLKPPHVYLGCADEAIPQTCSTDVRNALRGKTGPEALTRMLDPAVLKYIQDNGLYGVT